MAWFEYGTPKRRHLRRGVFLRPRMIPEDLKKTISGTMEDFDPKLHEILMVEVKEILPTTKEGRRDVIIHAWIRNFLQLDPFAQARLWFVVEIVTVENPEWVCEADIGRGLKGHQNRG